MNGRVGLHLSIHLGGKKPAQVSDRMHCICIYTGDRLSVQGETGVVGCKQEWPSPLVTAGVGQLLASGNGRRWVMRGDSERV